MPAQKDAFALWAITSQFLLTSMVGELHRAEGVICLTEVLNCKKGNSNVSQSWREAWWGVVGCVALLDCYLYGHQLTPLRLSFLTRERASTRYSHVKMLKG